MNWLLTLIATIHFGFPNFGERGPLWGWAFLVSDVVLLSYKALQNPLVYVMVLPPCLIYFFVYPNIWWRGVPMGLTMVPLGKQLVSSYRLLIQTTLVSGTVWPQFAMQVLTKGRAGRMGSEMRLLRSPSTTSYRLPITGCAVAAALL